MNKVREVENLIDVEDMDYAQVVKDKALERYENELSMIDEYSPFSNIPSDIAVLDERCQYYLYYYLTGVEVMDTNSSTKSNHLLSFIMTFDNWEEIIEKLFKVEPIIEYGKDGEAIKVGYELKKRDPRLYAKWNMRAMRVWNENTLNKYIKSFEQVLNGNIDKNEELKRKIYDDAMNASDRVDRTNNRKMYIDISGMKNESKTPTFNVFLNGGGDKRATALSHEFGIKKVDYSDVIDE